MARDASLSSAYWLGLVHRFQAEGGSVIDFCREVDVSPAEFRRCHRSFQQDSPTPQAFVPVAIHQSSTSSLSTHGSSSDSRVYIEIDLPNAIVRVAGDQETLRTVLLSLKEQPC